MICVLGVFVFKLLKFNEIFTVQGQRDREHLTESVEGIWLAGLAGGWAELAHKEGFG